MDFLKSTNALPFSQIYTAGSPIDRTSHLALLITYGKEEHSYLLSQMLCDNYGINCSVLTGITKANGRNYTVKELKANYEKQRELEHEYERSRW